VHAHGEPIQLRPEASRSVVSIRVSKISQVIESQPALGEMRAGLKKLPRCGNAWAMMRWAAVLGSLAIVAFLSACSVAGRGQGGV
jgi:hypothetical protein